MVTVMMTSLTKTVDTTAFITTKQAMYNVTSRRVLVTTGAVEKQ